MKEFPILPPPQPALSKLHLNAMKRFLSAREGLMMPAHLLAYGAPSPPTSEPLLSCQTTSSKAKLQTRALCQLRNHHGPGRIVCPIPQPLLSAAQLPKPSSAIITKIAEG